jgi:hypothetical protein
VVDVAELESEKREWKVFWRFGEEKENLAGRRLPMGRMVCSSERGSRGSGWLEGRKMLQGDAGGRDSATAPPKAWLVQRVGRGE